MRKEKAKTAPERIAINVMGLRNMIGMSEQEFAHNLGVALSDVIVIEKGLQHLNMQVERQLLDKFYVTLPQLVCSNPVKIFAHYIFKKELEMFHDNFQQ